MKEIVVISGGAGSGGSYLAEYILENHPSTEVNLLVRWHSTTNLNNINHLIGRTGSYPKVLMRECDLLDLSAIIRLFRKIKPTRIFNLASHANVRVCFDNPIAVLNNNVMLMANLLEAVRLECPEAIFLQCSTSEVYGNPITTPMNESHPQNPVNPYAVSKQTQESLAYAYYKSWNLRCIITRMFAYINPRRKDLFASAFARQIVGCERGTQSILSHGNLNSIRTLIDVRDAMRSYWIACEKCEPGIAYNIGGRITISVHDVLCKLLRLAKCPIASKQDPSLLRPVDVTKQIPDTTRFDILTGWKPEYTLDKSLEFLLNYYREELK